MQQADASPSRSRISRSNGSQWTTCSKAAAPSRLIVDEHRRIADWCEARIEHFAGWGTDPTAIGWERDGELTAGVVYTNFSPGNVFASIALDGALNRRFLYAIFYNPFVAWGVRHISCTIERSNRRSIKLCSHLGFKLRGVLPESAVNGEDVIIMGLLKKDCRFIR